MRGRTTFVGTAAWQLVRVSKASPVFELDSPSGEAVPGASVPGAAVIMTTRCVAVGRSQDGQESQDDIRVVSTKARSTSCEDGKKNSNPITTTLPIIAATSGAIHLQKYS